MSHAWQLSCVSLILWGWQRLLRFQITCTVYSCIRLHIVQRVSTAHLLCFNKAKNSPEPHSNHSIYISCILCSHRRRCCHIYISDSSLSGALRALEKLINDFYTFWILESSILYLYTHKGLERNRTALELPAHSLS